ncbi:carbohydrate ABC transporter permease, partial [Nostoc sp. NIES-2111]
LWPLVCLGPLYWLAITSLKGPAALLYGPFYVPGLDFTPELGAWRDVLDTGEIVRRYANTAIVAAVSTALTMLVSLPALFAGRSSPLLTTLVLTRIIPPVALVLPIYLVASALGLLDTRMLMVGVYAALNLPAALWLLRPAFDQRLQAVEEAATLDGASRLRILFDIVIPVILRPVSAVALLVLVLCWNEYLLASFLAAGDAQTLPPFIAGQMSIREQQAGSDPDEISRLAAATVMLIAPLVLVTGWAQRTVAARNHNRWRARD